MFRNEWEFKQEINGYVAQCGGSYSSWCIGVSENPRAYLFKKHKVDEKNDYWIIRAASSSDIAKRIKEYFVQTQGMEGGSDEDANKVYAYKKNDHTDP